MYQPPERIRHRRPAARSPSASEAHRSLLFSPLRLKSGLVLPQRTWVPAMVPWRASPDGEVTEPLLAWYERFAAGRPGAIVVEATGIRDIPSGPLLRIGHDRFIAGLRQLTDRVRAASGGQTRLFIQLIDFLRIRRRPAREAFLGKFLDVRRRHRAALTRFVGDASCHDLETDEVRAALLALDDDALEQMLSPRELEAMRFGERERVWDTQKPHIASLPRLLPRLFADAAVRAKLAGFDGVELHYAHAYTMASFLSARNRRADGYGGSRRERARLPLEVYRRVRASVGTRFTVGCRMLCDEIIAGGSRLADACYFGEQFAKAGMDYISLSTGGKFEDAKQPGVGAAAYPYTGESGWECMPTVIADARGPFGRNVPKQAQVRSAIRRAGLTTPVVVCGGIHSFDQAERILRAGAGDIVAAARQSLADPDWFRKTLLGRADEVRRCKYTNYCEALDQRHRQVTCQLWDRSDVAEAGVMLSHDGKRRLVAPRWTQEPSIYVKSDC